MWIMSVMFNLSGLSINTVETTRHRTHLYTIVTALDDWKNRPVTQPIWFVKVGSPVPETHLALFTFVNAPVIVYDP